MRTAALTARRAKGMIVMRWGSVVVVGALLIQLIAPSATAGRSQTGPGSLFVPSRPYALGFFRSTGLRYLTVKSGQTVRIDTVSQRGLNQDQSPVDDFGAFGVRRDEVLKDLVDIWKRGAAGVRPVADTS